LHDRAIYMHWQHGPAVHPRERARIMYVS
jgi:hypothetical protein